MANIFLNMTLSDLQPYILGKKFEGKAAIKKRCTEDNLRDFLTMLEEDPIAKKFFDIYSSAKDFYITAADFKAKFDRDIQSDVFYAAKNGCLYYELPAQCAYVLKRAYKEAFEIPNLIMRVIPPAIFKDWFAEGHFPTGISLYDAIASVCDANYYPLSITHLKNKVNNYTELYIQSEDMVAAVPNDIADRLDDESIKSICVQSGDLMCNGVRLRTMCEYFGAVDSTYDLRKLI